MFHFLIWLIWKKYLADISLFGGGVMGTSTLFRRFNDLGGKLSQMSKGDLQKIDGMSPWGKKQEGAGGWSILMELHNGDVHPLVWWYGRLFHLRDAPSLLSGKHYNKHTGRYSSISEWTLLRKSIEMQLKTLDRQYRRMRARQYRKGRSRKLSP